MIDQENDSNGFVLKIPASFFKKQEDSIKDSLIEADDYNFFKKTNIIPIKVERNSEHGKTEVQSLDFVKPEQRLKVLELLDLPGLYNKLPNILNYIYKLGCQREGEKRYYAAVAIGELTAIQPFLDIKEAVILPWAKDGKPAIRNSAAVALSILAKNERLKSEVLNLLRHWVSINNPLLINVALRTFYWIANLFPKETLEAMEIALKNTEVNHYFAVIDLFESIYDNSPSLAIDRLHKWLIPVTHTDLCLIAGELSFKIQLDDATADEVTLKKVVEMVFSLWDNPKMPLHEIMQEQTTELMAMWASETVDKMNQRSASDQNIYLAFFHQLYKKFEIKNRRNRLDFYLRRWEKNALRARDRSKLRAIRRGEDSSVEDKDKFSYRHLLP